MPRPADIPENIGELIAEHTRLYLTDPARAHLWDSAPVGVPGPVTTLLLTTRGRKTGQERHVPLLYVEHGSSYLVVGSKGGSSSHPVWYLNLESDLDCEIRVGTLRTRARARTLDGADYDRAWQTVTGRHPVYLRYQGRTERRIPLVALEPVGARA